MPAIKKPNQHFDATLWTGDGTTSPRSITNAGGFQPDLVWSKNRTSAYNHQLFDSVRGTGSSKNLMSNSTDAEGTNASSFGFLSAFNSNGFSLTKGTDPGNEYLWVGKTSDNYVAWQWKAGGAAVSNTAGSISSQVSVNTTSGFSVVTYTGTGATATVGHGLGVTPALIIVKCRNAGFSTNWVVWSNQFASLTNNFLVLNDTSSTTTLSNYWGAAAPTSSVFGVANGAYDNNHSGLNLVAYCWTPIAGYSAMGSYTGNGSADGPFVYLGFRPRFILVKSTGASNWFFWDTARNAFNATTTPLFPNSSSAEEVTLYPIDVLSNGFKLRGASGLGINESSNYIYMAFAEAPFKFANAR